MKLSFTLHSKKKHAQKKLHLELDPRRYWVLLLSLFILALAAELVYFSWLFWKTQRTIDAPATPIIETNAAVVKSMNKTLDTVEQALLKRTGEMSGDSSQTGSSVVE